MCMTVGSGKRDLPALSKNETGFVEIVGGKDNKHEASDVLFGAAAGVSGGFWRAFTKAGKKN